MVELKKPIKITAYILLAILAIVLVMAIFKICPPNGPWIMPPWCNEQPNFSNLFDQQIILTNIDMNTIPLIKSSKLNQLNVHSIGWQGFSVENIGFRSGSWNFVNTANKNNLPVISSMNLIYLIRSNQIDYVHTASVDLYSNPIDLSTIEQAQGIIHGSYYRNILHPEYKEMILKDAKRNIDVGVEGIVFDDSGSVSDLIYKQGGSFDQYSMDGFKEFLKSKYSTTELLNLGIENIEEFNFKDYIFEKGLENTWNSREPFPLQITSDFEEFLSNAKKQVIKEIVQELKEYARNKNQNLFVSFNIGPLFSENLQYGVYDLADFLYAEHFWFDKEHIKGSVAIKLGEGIYKNNYVLLLEVKHDHGTLKSGKNLYKYAYADVFSTGKGSMQISYPTYWTMKDWNYVEGLAYDLDVLERYNSFLKNNSHLFSLQETSNVAIIHSTKSRFLKYTPQIQGFDYTKDPDKQLITLIDMMLDINIPFDMIVSGNNNIKNKITLDQLKEYELIILPSIVFIEDEEIIALKEYVQQGGKILQINDFGSLANKDLINEIKLLSQSNTNSWITKDYKRFETYLFNDNGFNTLLNKKIENEVLKDLKNTILEMIETDFKTNTNTNINVRRFVDNGRKVFHIVNYDYDHLTDTFNPTDEFNIYLTKNNYETVYIYDIDTDTKSNLEINDLVLTIPSFKNYVIVELK
ncbi:MAG: hypothetical protein ACMXX9_03090 [Candidatus Woesearchaeota archaeon]